MLPLVYLDTQDYSNFGNVLRGRGSAAHQKVFAELNVLADEGRAKFVYSMPVLSELLQFDPEHEETSRAKAKAIEQLCRGHAIAYPPKVLAYEIALFAFRHGLTATEPAEDLNSADDIWYPDLGDVLEEFRAQVEEEAAASPG